MTQLIEFTPSELIRHRDISATYNKGEFEKALGMSVEFVRDSPSSPLARYNLAVLQGDFSQDPRHDLKEREFLKNASIAGLQKLVADIDLKTWPLQFQMNLRNEYYFHSGMSEAQYELGLEMTGLGLEGDFSACVGSVGVALKKIRSGLVDEGENWAKKSLIHYHSFVAKDLQWHSIHYFGAQAFACAGRESESKDCWNTLQRLLETPMDQKNVDAFNDELKTISRLRHVADKSRQ